ncbi:hypothetical protein ACFE04_007115 [Oxalis oulophora]
MAHLKSPTPLLLVLLLFVAQAAIIAAQGNGNENGVYHPSKTAKCKNKAYTRCYDIAYPCPTSCPGGCEVDCTTCKAVCKCDQPGAVCQDPRFIGADGIQFYFHGKKDRDFCLVSDSNLHINGHFIGKRNENMKRDFTWVQSIAVLFDKHQLFIGALKTSKWEDSVDRLVMSFDGAPVTIEGGEGAKWQSAGFSITRMSETNSIVIEAEGNFKLTAKVVPITEEDSRIHNYGITEEDCFAHLDLGFKFYSLTNEVNGVLGQTYCPDYVSRVNVKVSMPVMGGNREFKTSSLFAPDCAVARFSGNGESEGVKIAEMPDMKCGSGMGGGGVPPLKSSSTSSSSSSSSMVVELDKIESVFVVNGDPMRESGRVELGHQEGEWLLFLHIVVVVGDKKKKNNDNWR